MTLLQQAEYEKLFNAVITMGKAQKMYIRNLRYGACNQNKQLMKKWEQHVDEQLNRYEKEKKQPPLL